MTVFLGSTKRAPATAISSAEPLAELIGADVDVPLVQGGPPVRYANLDYAASAPALRRVAERVTEFLPLYSSVHRGAGYHSQVCTTAYEAARRTVAGFVGARRDDVVIFTRNTTDALNLLAHTLAEQGTGPSPSADAPAIGSVVYLDIEHHANLLPWQRLGGRAVLAGSSASDTLAAVEAELRRAPVSLLAVTGASNVTGEVVPLAELATLAHAHGARIVVDAAQLLAHRRVDIEALDIDYLAFSGHKLYAPFGSGALIGRRDWLDAAPPYLAGGGAVREVSLTTTAWTTSPARHEAGTPNVVGAVALAAAVREISRLGADVISAHETDLGNRLEDGLLSAGARLLRLWPSHTDRVGLVTFAVPGYSAELVAQYLSAEHGIGVRDGRFCAHPLLHRFDADSGAVRASLGLGSRLDDVERLVGALSRLRSRGPDWSYGVTPAGLLPVPDPRAWPAWLDDVAGDAVGGDAIYGRFPDESGRGAASPCRAE